jgi:hypothetical protein
MIRCDGEDAGISSLKGMTSPVSRNQLGTAPPLKQILPYSEVEEIFQYVIFDIPLKDCQWQYPALGYE